MSTSVHVRCSLALGLCVVVIACQRGAGAGPAADPAARGRYLVNAMGCADCHSPHDRMGAELPGMHLAGHPADAPLPKWDASMMKDDIVGTVAPSGSAFAGPFGISVASNLTPDPATGIAALTAQALIDSWRSGRHWREDRLLLPPMPAHAYRNLDDDDIRAIWSYLHSLAPVVNATPKSVAVGR